MTSKTKRWIKGRVYAVMQVVLLEICDCDLEEAGVCELLAGYASA